MPGDRRMTPQAVKEIVDAAGGRVTGRTRLQKSTYFLEAARVGYGFDFSYHYYGPYSEDLAEAANYAKALDLIDVRWDTSQTGLPYAVYVSNPPPVARHEGDAERRAEILHIVDQYDAIS